MFACVRRDMEKRLFQGGQKGSSDMRLRDMRQNIRKKKARGANNVFDRMPPHVAEEYSPDDQRCPNDIHVRGLWQSIRRDEASEQKTVFTRQLSLRVAPAPYQKAKKRARDTALRDLWQTIQTIEENGENDVFARMPLCVEKENRNEPQHERGTDLRALWQHIRNIEV
jgi:hypothetical protein